MEVAQPSPSSASYVPEDLGAPAWGAGGGDNTQASRKAGEPHACGKGGWGGGGEHRQLTLWLSKCLQRDRKPGQGSCCSGFSVGPPYANLAPASWPEQLAAAAQSTAGEGSPQPRRPGGREDWLHLMHLELGHDCPGPDSALAPPCVWSAWAGCAALS